jgi:hypothetical protein
MSMEARISRFQKLLEELLQAKPTLLLPMMICAPSTLPAHGAVYRIIEKGSDWQNSVYVGRTGNLSDRLYRNHIMGQGLKGKLVADGKCADSEAAKRYLQSCSVQYVFLEDDHFRKLFEHFVIAILQPTYND